MSQLFIKQYNWSRFAVVDRNKWNGFGHFLADSHHFLLATFLVVVIFLLIFYYITTNIETEKTHTIFSIWKDYEPHTISVFASTFLLH